MERPGPKTLTYRRGLLILELPLEFLYSPSHYWLGRQADQNWRVGLTKLGSRLLGEMVDYRFDVAPGRRVRAGEVIGWIEGFKAASDILALVTGEFIGANPALENELSLVNQDPHGAGWLYAVSGEPAGECVNAQEYSALLDRTLDLLGKSC